MGVTDASLDGYLSANLSSVAGGVIAANASYSTGVTWAGRGIFVGW